MSLALSTATAVVRRDGNPYQSDADSLTFMDDLLSPFGVDIDEDLLRKARNIGFLEMAEGLLQAAPIPGPELLILAYGIPDNGPLKTVSAHLNYLLGGRSRSFAISDQGLRAPFTALRIADAYARSGRCATLALFVCEQTSRPYPDAFIDENVLADSAALLYFDSQGSLEFSRVGPPVPADELGDLLAEMTTGLEPADALLVAGPRVDPGHLARTALPVHRGDAGTYCTTVWLDLARNHREWAARYQTIVLCDTDPRTGLGHAAVMRVCYAGQTACSGPLGGNHDVH
jgi:hypothetical protein